MSGTEQQQLTANDNVGQQQAGADSAISGQGRMDLYNDYKSTVGGQNNNEKSFSEQSLAKDGKSDVQFSNIYDQTVSKGDQGTTGQQGRDQTDP
jgi:hypothetical protein